MKKDAKLKAARYCAYQERSELEVRTRLKDFELREEEVDQIIRELRDENYLNEERFAEIYAVGKFRSKKWGKNKIRRGLAEKGITDDLSRQGLNSIEEEEYLQTIKQLVEKRMEEEKTKDSFRKNDRVATFLIRKGFEPDLVWEQIRSFNPWMSSSGHSAESG